jgi:putative endonuclease
MKRVKVFVSCQGGAVSAPHLEHGAAAERRAAEYLQSQGVAIVARNLRCKGGELDLVALDGPLLAVIEVRQRQRDDYGGALASVTLAKQRKIIRATRYLLQRDPALRHRMLRFDVIGVHGPPTAAHDIVWIKDAFRAPT